MDFFMVKLVDFIILGLINIFIWNRNILYKFNLLLDIRIEQPVQKVESTDTEVSKNKKSVSDVGLEISDSSDSN